jgi:hypothetical protein
MEFFVLEDFHEKLTIIDLLSKKRKRKLWFRVHINHFLYINLE